MTSLLARRIGASLARRVEFSGPSNTLDAATNTETTWYDGGPGERCYRSVLA